MLAGLGHDPVVRSHHEDHQVDPGGAGHHVADEAFVAGHVHDPDAPPVRKLQASEAEVDGHSPLLLLGPAVGVDAGESVDEGRLAVVNVTGGADDDGLDIQGGYEVAEPDVIARGRRA